MKFYRLFLVLVLDPDFLIPERFHFRYRWIQPHRGRHGTTTQSQAAVADPRMPSAFSAESAAYNTLHNDGVNLSEFGLKRVVTERAFRSSHQPRPQSINLSPDFAVVWRLGDVRYPSEIQDHLCSIMDINGPLRGIITRGSWLV